MAETETTRDELAEISGRPMVLVADDEDEVRDVVGQILESHDFQVCDARNGKEVLEQIGRQRIDLVILDLVMPDVEGIETLQSLRAARPDLKVLVMSGAFGGSFLHCAKLLGADAALKKPFSCESLLQCVTSLLDR